MLFWFDVSPGQLAQDINDSFGAAESALDSRLGKDEVKRELRAGNISRLAAQGQSLGVLRVKYPGDFQEGSQLKDEDGYAAIHKVLTEGTKFYGMAGDENSEGPMIIALLFRIAGIDSRRFLCTTDSGYIGLADHPIESGDLRCILF